MLCSVAQLQKTLYSTFTHLINTSSAQLLRSALRWCIYYWNKVTYMIHNAEERYQLLKE